MVIVRMGLCSNSVERFPNKLSYNEIFKMNSSVWRDVRSWNGSRSGIVELCEGNRVWRVSPDKNHPKITKTPSNFHLHQKKQMPMIQMNRIHNMRKTQNLKPMVEVNAPD